jgi:hypothetical protein
VGENIGALWETFESSHKQLFDHYRHLMYEVVKRVQTEVSPRIHEEILTVHARQALDEALELWRDLPRDKEKAFEPFATARIEGALRNLLARRVETSGLSSVAGRVADDDQD